LCIEEKALDILMQKRMLAMIEKAKTSPSRVRSRCRFSSFHHLFSPQAIPLFVYDSEIHVFELFLKGIFFLRIDLCFWV